jgi:predicted PurR-regulated permease PerM
MDPQPVRPGTGGMTAREQVRFWLIGIILFGVLLYVLRDIMLPFVAGMAVAYFLDPAADRLEEWGMSRTLATTVITTTFFLVFILFLLLLVPVIYEQLIGFAARVPGYVERLREVIRPFIYDTMQAAGIDIATDVKGALASYGQKIVEWIGKLVQGVWSGGMALINLLSLIFITPIVAFYLLRDWDILVGRIDGWLPRHRADDIRQIFRDVDGVLAGFARGQAIVCLILAIYYALALSLIGVEFGLIIGIVSGLISFVPFVGAAFGFVASVGVALVQFWPDYLPIGLVLMVYVVGQVAEGNFLTPKFVGSRVGLHPVWVVFGLLAGGALFGFVGVLIAVPVTAVVGVVIRFGLARYLASALFHGHRPDREQPPSPPPNPE